jgi:hypothetical protein
MAPQEALAAQQHSARSSVSMAAVAVLQELQTMLQLLPSQQRLAELLEAAGDGVRGTAAVQFSQPLQRR